MIFDNEFNLGDNVSVPDYGIELGIVMSVQTHLYHGDINNHSYDYDVLNLITEEMDHYSEEYLKGI